MATQKPKGGASSLSSITQQIHADMQNPRPRERPLPAPTQLMQFSEGFRQQGAELEKAKTALAKGFEASLEKLKSSPFQLMALDEERVLALVENLRHNPLNSPVVVRATAEPGVFELVAGHHRVEAFRRLGRESIRAVVSDIDDDEAERLVFYDNLFAPNICDYEKYLGFAQRRKSKDFSQGELAIEAGVSRALVNYLFSFERLPAKAQALIAENPKKASSHLFRALAPLSDAYPDRVVTAVGQVLTGELSLMRAAKWVTNVAANKPSVSETVFRKGSTAYAKLRVKGRQLFIAFKDESEAQSVSELIHKTLKERSGGSS